MSENTKKSIVVQGSILALAGLISKIIGFIYRIPMANIMGNTGNGIYSVAFGIYNIALTLSSYSMPLAVSKLISSRLAKGEYKNSRKLFGKALIFAFIAGMTACMALLFGAEFLAGLYKKTGLERPLRVLAPTTFVVAMLGTCRGYFQGHKTMVPTAVSQVIEQIINAIVSVTCTAYFVRSITSEAGKASYGAMGGTFGTLAGAMTALIFFIVLFMLKRGEMKEEMGHDDVCDEESGLIYKAIILTVIPVIISQSIYQLGYTMDDLLFGNLMKLKGVSENVATDLQGVFNTQYNQMINLPTAIATSMAAATLPSIVALFTVGKFDQVKQKMDTVLKVNMLIAIPSAVGLAVLADPIMSILFPRLKEYHDVAVTLLMTGSSAVIFYALSTLTTSILQGCNRMSVPVIHSGISLVIHIAIVAGLVYYTDLGVYGLVIGNVTFPLVVCILNCKSVIKLLEYKMDWSGVFFKPLISAAVMGAGTYGTYMLLSMLKDDSSRMIKLIYLCLSMALAGIIYVVMLGLLKTYTKDELKRMPLVKKFVK